MCIHDRQKVHNFSYPQTTLVEDGRLGLGYADISASRNPSACRFLKFLPRSAGIGQLRLRAVSLFMDWPMCRPFMHLHKHRHLGFPRGQFILIANLSASPGFAHAELSACDAALSACSSACLHVGFQQCYTGVHHLQRVGGLLLGLRICPLHTHLQTHRQSTPSYGWFPSHAGMFCRQIVAPILAPHWRSHDVGITDACRANGFTADNPSPDRRHADFY